MSRSGADEQFDEDLAEEWRIAVEETERSGGRAIQAPPSSFSMNEATPSPSSSSVGPEPAPDRGRGDDEEDRASTASGESWGGSERGNVPRQSAADVARQNAAMSGPIKICFEVMGNKRQRLKSPLDNTTTDTMNTCEVNLLPEDASDIDKLRCIPCMLSYCIKPTLPFDTAEINFAHIYSSRCLSGKKYTVPHKFARDDAARNDGLAVYICSRVFKLLSMQPIDSPAAEQTETETETEAETETETETDNEEDEHEPSPDNITALTRIGEFFANADPSHHHVDSVRQALTFCPPAVDPPVVDPPVDGVRVPIVRVQSVEVKFAQIVLRKTKSTPTMSSARTQDRGVRVDGGLLDCGDGRHYRPTTRKEALGRNEVTVVIGDGEALWVTVHVGDKHGVQYQIGGTDEWCEVATSLEEVHALLLPASWTMRDVTRIRRKHAHDDQKVDGVVDPYRLCLMAAALAGDRQPNRWVELMRIASSGMHVGIHAKIGGRDHVDIYGCSGDTMRWTRDKSDSGLKKLIRRICREVSDMTHDLPRAVDTLMVGAESNFFFPEEITSLVSKEELKVHSDGKKPVPPDVDAPDISDALPGRKLTVEMHNETSKAKNACNIIAEWDFPYISSKLETLLSQYDPDIGPVIKPGLVREAFADAILAKTDDKDDQDDQDDPSGVPKEDGGVKWDNEDIVCFDGGVCWSGRTASWRSIVPLDYVTVSVGYKKPVFNAKRRKMLMGLLGEIHTEPGVLEWRLGLKAKALQSGQAGPTLLSSQGAAGGCKSLETNLTLKAWGGCYSAMVDPRILCAVKNSDPNGASPAMLALRGRRYIVCDEVATFDPEVVKRLLGGGYITARGLHQDAVTFRLEFPVIETLSNLPDDPSKRINFPTDDGVVRRLRACHFVNRFENCANELQARRVVHVREQEANDCGDVYMDADDNDHGADTIQEVRRAPRDGDDKNPEVAHVLSFKHTMYPEKWKLIHSLAPDLMLYMTELHAKSAKSGWPAEPDIVARWTSQALASATTKSVIEASMRRKYVRCPCVQKVQPKDQMSISTDDLEEKDKATGLGNGTQCTHFIKVADICKELANTTHDKNDDRSVLRVACGNLKPNSKAGREMLHAKLRGLLCFLCEPEKDAKLTEPGAAPPAGAVPIALVVVPEHTATNANGKQVTFKFVIRGLQKAGTSLNGQFNNDHVTEA